MTLFVTSLKRFAGAVAFAAITLGPVSALADVQPTKGPQGYFVSIDGLNRHLLASLHEAGLLNAPKGLGWLRTNSFVADEATPAASLTAASHVSTITCSTPVHHGIVANGFITQGKQVSGYTHPFTTEPLWVSAPRQGKKVVALAYVGADGDLPSRTADFGLGYPSDSKIGPRQTLNLTVADLADASGWANGNKDVGVPAKETTLTIRLNPTTEETHTVNVLVEVRRGKFAVTFDNDKDLANGTFGTLAEGSANVANMYFIEADEASTLKGYKRRSFARLLPAETGKLSIYVSKASYNSAYPESFRMALDNANLVWPDYGVSSDKLSIAESLEAQAMIDRFLTTVATDVVPSLGADIVLFYQPLIDTIGHKLQGRLPLPFDPTATDEVTQAFVSAFRIVDQNLSKVFSSMGRNGVIALMGDHGMDPIKKQINLAKLMPADHLGNVSVVSSGAMTMLYTPLSATNEPATEDQVAKVNAMGESLQAALAQLQYEGASVGGKVFSKRDADPATWQFGEALWAFTSGTGFWYAYQPLVQDIFVGPATWGMHGHAVDMPTMATTLLIKGPRVKPRHIPHARLIDAAPTFSRLMGIEPPANCEGTDLLAK